jgi:hypothetical protein
MPVAVEALKREAKRIEEDALYSAKRHFNACAYWGAVHYVIGVPTVVIAALSATFAAGHHDATAVSLAATAAVLAGLTTFLNPNQRAAAHALSGNRYNALRNHARIFWQLDCADATKEPDHLRRQLGALDAQRNQLNEHSPSTPRIAFIFARRGIEGGEATYAADIDDTQA